MTCASTSSAFCTTRVGSTSPSRIAPTMASMLHARRRGRSGRTRRGSPRRASGRRGRRAAAPLATRFGLWSWSTRSTEPMSMPSSSELVRDERAQLARLEALLEHAAPLARERAVVRQRDLLAGERVDARGHLLGLRAVVDEDERRARVADVLEHERRDRRSRSSRRRGRDRRRASAIASLHLLHEPAVDDRRRAGSAACSSSASALAAAEESRDLLERALRRRESDALRRLPARRCSRRSSVSARCAPRFVPATRGSRRRSPRAAR